MKTADFLRLVLPADGFYFGVVVTKDGVKSKSFSEIDELAEFNSAVSNHGYDAYYAVSSFKEKTRRKQDNVANTKLFAFDIDVGKASGDGYPDRKSALLALQSFLETTQLPFPMLVSSGMGFHCYWVLTRPLEYVQWLPLAVGLKQLAIAQGLRIDPTVTADSARILRAPGTLHTKSGNMVKLLKEAAPVDPEIFSRIAPIIPAKKYNLLDSLKPTQNFPPAVAGIVATKCQQVNWAVNHQPEVAEPLWYALMGIAAFTENPNITAMAWSDQHPQYSKINTIQKVTQWKDQVGGPTTCAKLESLRPGGCKGCLFSGRVNTPARLGAQFQSVAAPANAPDPVTAQIPVPAPFKRTASGMKLTVEDTDIDICSFDIYPVSYGYDEGLGYEVVRFHWERLHTGWVPLVLRQAYLTDGHREFASTIADQGIVLSSKRQTELFQLMLRTYMDSLRQAKALTNLYSTMGWKDQHKQFVIGESIIRRDTSGQVVEERSALGRSAGKHAPDLYDVSGSLAAWQVGTAVLEKADMPWHMFALGVGFSAPLFDFGGLKGVTVSLYGPTGGGKTLIQYWIQSIYGNPDRLHFAAKFTQNTLFARLGMYNNLPMTIDEATMFQDKEVGDFLYWVSQGRDKARLDRSAQERDQKTWATPVILSTNKSLASKLISNGMDSDAQIARLLEINVPQHKLFGKSSEAGQHIYQHLMSNYGHAGRVYLRYLVDLGPDGIRAAIEAHRHVFQQQYGLQFSGEERYWEQVIVLADLGAKIAKDLNLINYDYTKGTQWVISQLTQSRRTIVDSRQDCFDILAQYANEFADSTVYVMQTGGATPQADMMRLPRGSVHVRIETWRKDMQSEFTKGRMLVDRTHFRRWLSVHGVDPKSLTTEITREGADWVVPHNKASLGKHTSIKVPQMYVEGFNLEHPRLNGVLSDANETVSDPNFNPLRVVK